MSKLPDFVAIGAANVYRTKNYIVAQTLTYKQSEVFDNVMLSHDTYFKRTRKRDEQYFFYFFDKDNLDGKRISSTSYTRKYVD